MFKTISSPCVLAQIWFHVALISSWTDAFQTSTHQHKGAIENSSDATGSSLRGHQAIHHNVAESVASSSLKSNSANISIKDIVLKDYPGSNNAFKLRLAFRALGLPFKSDWVDILEDHYDVGMIPKVDLSADGEGMTFSSSEQFFGWLNGVLGDASSIKPMNDDDLQSLLYNRIDVGSIKTGKTLTIDRMLNAGIQSYRGIVEYTLGEVISWERYAMKNENKPIYRRALDFAGYAQMPLTTLKMLMAKPYHNAKEAIAFDDWTNLDGAKKTLCILVQNNMFSSLAASAQVTIGDLFVFGNLEVLSRRHYRRLMLPNEASFVYQRELHGCIDQDMLVLSQWMDKMLAWLKSTCPMDGCQWLSGAELGDTIFDTSDRGTDPRTRLDAPWREIDDTKARSDDLRIMKEGYDDVGGI